jgi:hypothetical protein
MLLSGYDTNRPMAEALNVRSQDVMHCGFKSSRVKRPPAICNSSVFICGQFRDFIQPCPAFSTQSQPTRQISDAMNAFLQRVEFMT